MELKTGQVYEVATGFSIWENDQSRAPIFSADGAVIEIYLTDKAKAVLVGFGMVVTMLSIFL